MQTALSSIWVVRSVASVILIGTAWAMGYGATLFLQPLEQPNLPEVLVKTKAQVELQSGQASYVMGKPVVSIEKQVKQNEVQAEQVSKTRLRLELLGVIDVPRKGVALIRVSGKTKAVAEGEEIQKGVELLEVHSDLIILSHRGKREKLLMKQPEQPLFESSIVNKVAPVVLKPSEIEALREIRNKIQSNPLSVAKFVRFKPIGRSGDWSSIRVWPKTNRALFAALGFKSGDRIINVNGVSVAELSKQPRVWQELLEKAQFEVTVTRRGEEVPLFIELN